GLHAAVTRQRQDGSPGGDGWYSQQRLTVTEALRAYNLAPAQLAGWENHLGKLSPGFAADLLVLDRDPFVCPAADVWRITPRLTMFDGEWVWQA
ncbi:MAG TPA: amidohydrolase family protein, partial [Anaerolineales bacterium]|nr:amidohydrolase family protein [Anaerolineales bacterium]